MNRILRAEHGLRGSYVLPQLIAYHGVRVRKKGSSIEDEIRIFSSQYPHTIADSCRIFSETPEFRENLKHSAGVECDMISTKELFKRPAHKIISAVVANEKLQKVGFEYARRKLYQNIVENSPHYTRSIRMERYTVLQNLLTAIRRALANKAISSQVRDRLLQILVGKIFVKDNEALRAFVEKNGRRPPGFLTISPAKQCNLRCPDCYAASPEGRRRVQLDFDTVDKIITDKTRLWGSHFTVISGGEPFLWQPDHRNLIDLFRKHSENYFMVYTNGTLIDERIAQQLAEVGNAAPAISVEGFEERTDARRGKGAFQKIIRAMDLLRENGVPFGMSVTATKNNVDEILTDEFVDFFFNEKGVVYGWIFQYMPIGCSPTLDTMVTPEQRKWMFEREQYFLHEKQIFYPDFWNSGVLGEGCLAAGRSGGYFYIDWNGNITPCVFFPYAVANIKDIHAAGGTVSDVLDSPLFARLRKWQYKYGYGSSGKDISNWIAPCSIRDHYRVAREAIDESKARPIDDASQAALEDPEYYKGMATCGDRFRKITDHMWQRMFLEDEEFAAQSMVSDVPHASRE
jgi:MoaA/NifB/PqqE/SkfB family radical SAM enzyme